MALEYPVPEHAPETVVVGWGATAHRCNAPWFSWEAEHGMCACIACSHSYANKKVWVSSSNHLGSKHQNQVINWRAEQCRRQVYQKGWFKTTTIEENPEYRWAWSPEYQKKMTEAAQALLEQRGEQSIDLHKLNEKIDELGEKVNDMTHLQKLYETIAALGEKMDALQNAADKTQTDREVLSAKLDRLVKTIGTLQQNIDTKLSVGVV
ncbi:unnamed protein product, partial [Prorocentrum cordatum]